MLKKYIKMVEKLLVYMCVYIASVKSTGGNKTSLFSSPLLIFTSWFLFLAEALRNDQVAACFIFRRMKWVAT